MNAVATAEREINLLGPTFDSIFTEEPIVPVIRPAKPEIIVPTSNIVIQTSNGTYHTQSIDGVQSFMIVDNSANNFFTTSVTSATAPSNRIYYTSDTNSTTAIVYPPGPQIIFNTVSGTATSSTFTNGTVRIYSNGLINDTYWRTNTGRVDRIDSRVGVKKTVRNSIKRALKMLDNFGMEEDSKIFLNGQEVEISHPDSMFKFVITKRKYNNIISATEFPIRSVPFSLELFTKTGIHVANLCVYAEDTPMLDQLFMIAMYVKSGNEEDLLRKANFFSVSPDAELKEIIVNEIDYLKPKLLR